MTEISSPELNNKKDPRKSFLGSLRLQTLLMDNQV